MRLSKKRARLPTAKIGLAKNSWGQAEKMRQNAWTHLKKTQKKRHIETARQVK